MTLSQYACYKLLTLRTSTLFGAFLMFFKICFSCTSRYTARQILKNIKKSLKNCGVCKVSNLKQCIHLFLILTLTLNPLLISVANAAQNDISVDTAANSAYQATLKSSADGVDVVDITAPTVSGVSINHFNTLNNTKGLIFNNSQYDGTYNIGGFVAGNVNMNQPGSNAAAIILNQVNGTSRSHFSNVTEIFGADAKFIISNPNGVTCNGCGFIGAPKITFTTGNPTYNNGDWTGNLSINNGDVKIDSLGLLNDNSDIDYVDIIAKSVEIVGELSSNNEVNILAGRNDFDYNTGQYTKKADDNSAKPELAIDAGLLGSITSGRIRMIATQEGVGVKTLGNVTSNSDDIIITANGNIEVKNLDSAQDVKITNENSNSKITIQNGGEVKSKRDIILTSQNNILNEGTITANYNVETYALNQIQNDGTINASNNLIIKKESNSEDNIKEFINNGSLDVQNDLQINSDEITFANNPIATARDIIIKAINYNNSSLLQAGRNIILTLTGLFTNTSTSRIHGLENIHIIANAFKNYGVIDAGKNLRIKVIANDTKDANIIEDINNQIVALNRRIDVLKKEWVYENGEWILEVDTQNLITELNNKKTQLANLRSSYSSDKTASNDIVNEGLLYADNEISLYATNNALNKNTIFANSDIYIGDRSIDKKMALDLDQNANTSNINDLTHLTYSYTNSSGSLETLGDLYIELEGSFNNKRTSVKTQYSPSHFTDRWCCDYYGRDEFYDIKIQGSNTDESLVTAKNIISNTKSFINDASTITASEDINITTDLFINNAYYLETKETGFWHVYGAGSGKREVIKSYEDIKSIIQANGEINIVVDGSLTTSNSSDNPDLVAGLFNSGTIYGGQNVTIQANGADILSDGLSGVIVREVNIDLSKFTPKVDGVVLRINDGDVGDNIIPSYKFYLVSTIYEFDNDKYLSQAKFIDQAEIIIKYNSKINSCVDNGNILDLCIGIIKAEEQINSSDTQRTIYTDPKTLNDQIRSASIQNTGLSTFTNAKDSEEDRKNLYDNALEFVLLNSDLGIEFGEELTASQQEELDKPILWYVNQEVDGKMMLVAKVYTPIKTILQDTHLATAIGSLNGELNINAVDGDILLRNTVLNSSGDLIINSNQKVSLINSDKELELIVAGNTNFDDSGELCLSGSCASAGSGLGAIRTSFVTDDVAKNDAITLTSSLSYNAGTDIEISGSDVTISNNYNQAGGSIFITATSGDINNTNYQITAGDDVVLSAVNNINNIHAGDDNVNSTKIEAGDILSVQAGGDITNRGATLSGENLVYLNAVGDVNNEALINRTINGKDATKEEVEASNADNIRSTLISRGEIKSESGDVVIVADNGDINNVASDITSANQTYLEATSGDVNIVTDTLRDRTVRRWHGKKNRGMSISDTTTNVASTIDSGGELNIVSGGDTNILGSDVNVTGDFNNDAGGDLNIASVKDSDYYFTANYKRGSMGSRSSTSMTSNKITNRESNINITGDMNTDVKRDINLIASNITSTAGNINLTAKENVNIVSDQDINYVVATSKKTGTTTRKVGIDLTSSAIHVSSDIAAVLGDVNIKSGGDTSIIASNLSGGGSGNIEVGSYTDPNTLVVTTDNAAKLEIASGVDSVMKASSSAKYVSGVLNEVPIVSHALKAINVTFGTQLNVLTGNNLDSLDSVIGDVKDRFNNSSTNETLVASNISFNNNVNATSTSDLTIKGSDVTSVSGDVSLTSTVGNVTIMSASTRNTSTTNTSFKNGRDTHDRQVNRLDIVNHQLNINAGNDVVVTSANDVNIVSSNVVANNDVAVDAGNNLNLLVNQDVSTFSDKNKKKGTYWQSSATQDSVDTNVVNNQIVSNNDQSVTLDATNNILSQYEKGQEDNLSYLSNLDQNKTTKQEISKIHITQVDNSRSMTEAGMAYVATAAIIGSGGIATSIGNTTATAIGATGAVAAGVSTATAAAITSAAATAAVSAVNNHGNLGRAIKEATSKESLENIAIAAAAAGVAGATAHKILGPTSTAVTTASSLKDQIQNALIENAVNNLTSTATRSALTGDSFEEALKDQAENIAISTVAQVAANNIGATYKTSEKTDFDKLKQLTSHAVLGGATAKLKGSDVTSGAAAGVVGEVVGERLRDSGVNKQTGVQVSGLAGAVSSIMVSGSKGESDKEIAESIYSGSSIGSNAAANNAYFALRPLEDSPISVAAGSKNPLDDLLNTEAAHEQLFFEDEEGGNIGFFSDNKVRPDKDNLLDGYVVTKTGFDDSLMREAVDNVKPKPYNLFGDIIKGCSNKYNCQDWAQDVRKEYNKLQNNK